MQVTPARMPVLQRAPSNARPLSIFISHPSEFLTDHEPHGDGLAAYEVIRRLAERGHRVHVAIDRSALREPLPSNVVLHDVGVRLPFATTRPIEYMLRVRRVFRELRRSHHVDIIHQLNPVNHGLSAALVGLSVPLVLGAYVPDWPSRGERQSPRTSVLGHLGVALTRPVVEWADRYQEQHAAALLLSTPRAHTRLHSPGAYRRGTIAMMPYGVDTEFFSPQPVLNTLPAGPPQVLFLAGLHERKGIRTLLEAFDRVLECVPNCRLVVAGDGPLRHEVENRVRRFRSPDQVTVLGAVNRLAVRDLMRACTVYCLPSFGEPFGLSALEAMACGKPVVGTDAGGLRHVVPADGGRTVPPGDTEALGRALVELVSRPDLMRSMGEGNRAMTEERYSWAYVIDKLVQIYHNVLRVTETSGTTGEALHA